MNKRWMALFAAFMLTPAALAAQERSVAVSVRAGLNVPTFDITDIAETGPGFGFGVQAPVGDRLFVRGTARYAAQLEANVFGQKLEGWIFPKCVQ